MLFVVVVAAITVQQHRRQANVKVEYAFKSAISQACKFITTYVGMNTDIFGIHVQMYVRHIAHSTLTHNLPTLRWSFSFGRCMHVRAIDNATFHLAATASARHKHIYVRL